MPSDTFKQALRFYFITDDQAPRLTAPDQVEIALKAGATMIQYRRKNFDLRFYDEARAVQRLCRASNTPFIVNDLVLLAQALGADGVHLGQADTDPAVARHIMGPRAIIGVSISNLYELAHTDLGPCNYVGSGPVFPTGTKADAKKVRNLTGLKELTRAAPLPVVAIGGIDHSNAAACFEYGAAGIAVISAISRARNPLDAAMKLGAVCGTPPRTRLLP
jgi:thiamine-phosphate pyrophosphorylase